MRRTPRDGGGPPHPPQRTLRLILDLDLGETAHGTVGPVDGPRAGFHGWIGLMTAIHEFCSEAGQAPPPPEQGTAEELP